VTKNVQRKREDVENKTKMWLIKWAYVLVDKNIESMN
jgi:hypothetical protein